MIALVVLGFLASDTLVTNVDEFTVAARGVAPGDTITLADGIWRDASLVLDADGAKGDTIVVRSASPGGVLLTGTSSLRLGGSYLKVEGLWFYRGALMSGHVVAFRTDRPAHHSRITECAITEYNPDDWLVQYKWLSLYGTHNRVDRCLFSGKTHDGATLVVWLEDPPDDAPNFHRIDRNYFGTRPVLGKNGGETIRIGTSHRSMQDSQTLVERNLFENADGEHEIISNKSGLNVFRYNTFRASAGALTLRHGNGATVTGNHFLGEAKAGTGGVRVIGEDHLITNNYFEDLMGDSSRAALSIMNGIPDSPLNRYFQVRNVRIEGNTMMGNRVSVLYGLGADSEKTLMPDGVSFVGNLVSASDSMPIVTTLVALDGASWSGNVLHGAELGMDLPPGTSRSDTTLRKGPDSLWVSSSGEGASVLPPPLTADLVGPSWWSREWSPEGFGEVADFSWAGYRSGEEPIPSYRATLDVVDFGATGSDMNDDTNAFKSALAAAHARPGLVVLHIPAGTFHLSGVLFLERDSLIIRGSGPDYTTLVVEKALGALEVPEYEPIRQPLVHGRQPSRFTEWGGLFWARVPTASEPESVATVLSGNAGSHEIQVTNAASLGGALDLVWTDPSLELAAEARNRQSITVDEVVGDIVRIKEPLIAQVRAAAKPVVVKRKALTHIAVEQLRVEYEQVPYSGFGLEDGYNAVYLRDVRHGWVRGVVIQNADTGVIVEQSANVTIADVTIQGRQGRAGVLLKDSQYSLVRNVQVTAPLAHGMSVAGGSAMNVFYGGAAPMLSVTGPTSPTLFDSVALTSDGAPLWDLHQEAHVVLWNLRADYNGSFRMPAYTGALGNSARAIGLMSGLPIRTPVTAEGTNRPGLAVPSLYIYQMDRRPERVQSRIE